MYTRKREKMNRLIIDTETFNKAATFSIYGNMVFDLGFVIVNEEKEILFEYNAIASDIYEDETLKNNTFFTKEKLLDYDRMIENGAILYKTFNEIEEDVVNYLDKYNVGIIAAYNINFDMKALTDTSIKYGDKALCDLGDKYHIEDIWHMACQALSTNEVYPIISAENGKVSDKGNINTNAEAVYCFIKNDYSFVESHTALRDAQIEKEIYDWVLALEEKNEKKFIREAKTSCWRLVQPKKKK